MEKMNQLTEQERLELFQVEELETRLEMWFDKTNTTCPTTNNGCQYDSACYDSGCSSNYGC